MRIAFIACNRSVRLFRRNPSFVYRCENVAAWLTDQGHEVYLCHLRNAPSPQEIDAAIFHRPRASWRLRWLLWRYRRSGVETIADVDDLIFDEKLVRHSPAIRNRRVPFAIQWRIFRLQRRALSWFENLTVATHALALHAAELFPDSKTAVFHNSVFWSWRKNSNLVPKLASSRPFVLAYMPGTRSHDRDFVEVGGALQRFLRNHPDTVLRITGPLNFRLDVPEGQLLHEELVPFEQYPSRYEDVWINLAPLEQSPFNQCKSALKALEAGYMGVPTLCSPNPDMDRFRSVGAVIVDDGDWYAALARMRDEVFYRSLTEGLRDRVLAIANVEAHGEGLLNIIAAGCQRKS